MKTLAHVNHKWHPGCYYHITSWRQHANVISHIGVPTNQENPRASVTNFLIHKTQKLISRLGSTWSWTITDFSESCSSHSHPPSKIVNLCLEMNTAIIYGTKKERLKSTCIRCHTQRQTLLTNTGAWISTNLDNIHSTLSVSTSWHYSAMCHTSVGWPHEKIDVAQK